MAESRQRKLAVILHADVVGSTTLVQRDETLAHERITDAFHRFASVIGEYGGTVHELRGDALLAEFARASDAVCAAIAFQSANEERYRDHHDELVPVLRVGLGMGEVVIADGTLTGAGVVIAQRVEQLAGPGGVCVQGAAYETVPMRLPFEFENLGERKIKGFEDPIRVYRVDLAPGETVPFPEQRKTRRHRWFAGGALVFLLAMSVGLAWWRPWLQTEPPNRLVPPGSNESSIAVLPFQNLSGDSEQGYFADGLTEDFTTVLGKIPELLVIARSAAAAYDGKQYDVKQVARELGVGHVLRGSVQKSGPRLRVSAQLVDGASGEHVWSERYDRAAINLFDLQDEIVRNVLIELQVELTIGETARVLSRGTRNLDAWVLNTQALAEGFKFTQEAMVRSRELYTAASKADPHWAHPVGGLAWTYYEQVRRGWSKSVEEDRRRGIELARKAITMDADEPLGYMQLGNLFIERGDYEQGIALREKAIELAPNHFYAIAGLAWRLPLVGQEKRALALYERARAINPLYPWWLPVGEGVALHVDGQVRRAIDSYKEGLTKNDHLMIHGRLAAAYADLDLLEEARERVRIVMEKNPEANVEDFLRVLRFQDPKRVEWYSSLLTKAGIPE